MHLCKICSRIYIQCARSSLIFTGRQHSSKLCRCPVLAVAKMFVWSICPSHSDTVSKRRKLGSQFLIFTVSSIKDSAGRVFPGFPELRKGSPRLKALHSWNFACPSLRHVANYSCRKFSSTIYLLARVHPLQTDGRTDDNHATVG